MSDTMPITNWLRMKAEVVKERGQFANTGKSHLRLIEAADRIAALETALQQSKESVSALERQLAELRSQPTAPLKGNHEHR